MSHHEEHHDGYEDPAQRPRSEAREHGPTAFESQGEQGGRWPQGTLFVAVVVLLVGTLAVLAIVGLLATR